ncbi:MAG TPA: 30S ribosomal protein S6 [Acidobacteriota bacterium]
MRLYELVTISPPAMGDEEVEALAGEISGLLQGEGAELVRLDRWGKKRLAYPINRHQEGLYLYALYKTEGDISNSVERKLRLRESILRLQIVRIDEELRRAKTDVSSILPQVTIAEPLAAAVDQETDSEAGDQESGDAEASETEASVTLGGDSDKSGAEDR